MTKRFSVRAAAAVVLAGATAIGVAASPAYADAKVQLPGNAAGIQYTSSGDIFEIWDNVKDGKAVYGQYNYVAVDDSWTTMRVPVDYASGYTYDESLIQSRQIYIRVCRSEPLVKDVCSASVKSAV